jgi:hypothetical protein
MYYYFVASLPFLEFGTRCPTCLEDFLEQAERLLPADDFALVRQALSVAGGEEFVPGHRVVREWREFIHTFRGQAVLARAPKLKKDPANYQRGEKGYSQVVADALAAAEKAPDPLAAERIIDQLLWDRCDQLGEGHSFDLDFLLVFALKLQILKRVEQVDSVQGRHLFDQYRSDVSRLG